MALAYVLLALVIIALNIRNLPHAFAEIIGGAFGLQQIAGGFTGGIAAAVLNGVKRGLFSNGAGMGSAPNVAAGRGASFWLFKLKRAMPGQGVGVSLT